ncbi:hypothetical protein [Microbacterium sp. SSM24]|uniref:hypothetical protein n=1 Tax=Microbacterium sp. SSM24 TaxID=2991714 RepID=UPI002226BAF1|nr:hypothetical protein [Microbacterium sp. SSM24]MCW3493099.1 hypothetical protein [Microbacterium sp. SSM24]
MPRIRFLVEDFVEFPIWPNDPGDDRDPLELREQLPLSEPLLQRLFEVSREYNQRDLASLPADAQASWYLDFDRRAHKLALAVENELGESFEVTFIPITAEYSSSI